jgi:hypothetical protein
VTHAKNSHDRWDAVEKALMVWYAVKSLCELLQRDTVLSESVTELINEHTRGRIDLAMMRQKIEELIEE